jgi:8-oxo-dGTP pyrophosphatase MutT (NUDIX family)
VIETIRTEDKFMAHADTDYAHPGERRIGGLVLLRNTSGDVLLVKPSYKEGYQLVGGGAAPDELPHLAARREAIEETGLTNLVIGDLLVTDYVPANPETGAKEGINFVFDGGVLPDDTDITLPTAKNGQEPELTDWAWVPVRQLADHCGPYQHRRITEALAALANPTKRGYRLEGQTV